MTKSRKATNAPSPKQAAAAATRTRKAKRAPGDLAALDQRAADNIAKLNKQRGKAEVITVVKNTTEGHGVYVEGSKGSHFVRPRSGDTKEFRSYASNGALYEPAAKYNATNPAPKPQARLANGVDARTAPHSAAAVRDQNSAAAKSAPKGKGKAAAPKAGKGKQPSAGTNRAYTVGKTKNSAKADSWRGYMLGTIMGAKDTDSAKAKHAKAGKFSDKKLDFNWAAAQGYIAWSK